MLPSNQDFLRMIEHEKNHKRFIFVCGFILGVLISGICYWVWEVK